MSPMDPISRDTAADAVSHRSRRGRSVVIVLITCFCGWLVMELEILGARMLIPYFGSNIVVTMGSVIGVFLLSLAVGYMLGGWMSSSPNSKPMLGIALSAAGGWLCLMPLFADPICDALFGLGDKLGSLAAALILFGPPTVMLGTVSPTAVRWLTRKSDESGRKTGIVLGFSTVASFAGCVVTAFYLVLLSVQWTLQISGALLAALGVTIFVHSLTSPKGMTDHAQSAGTDSQ